MPYNVIKTAYKYVKIYKYKIDEHRKITFWNYLLNFLNTKMQYKKSVYNKSILVVY